MSISYQKVHNLKISKDLLTFVNNELLKGLNISSEKFWSGFDKIIHDLSPQNRKLIEVRENLQNKID